MHLNALDAGQGRDDLERFGREAPSCSGGNDDSAASPIIEPTDGAYAWLKTLQAEEEDQDKLCVNCPLMLPENYPMDLEPMWLHAVEYSSPRWSFTCPPPSWAEPDWTPAA